MRLFTSDGQSEYRRKGEYYDWVPAARFVIITTNACSQEMLWVQCNALPMRDDPGDFFGHWERKTRHRLTMDQANEIVGRITSTIYGKPREQYVIKERL